MKHLIIACLALFVAACTDPIDTITSKKSAVVAIAVVKDGSSDSGVGGIGTGWLLKPNFIVTNYHVIENAKRIMVASENSDIPHEATLLFGDELADVAVIQLKDWEAYTDKNPVSYLNVAERDTIKTAETVYSIGHPWGLFFTVSRGIVSNNLRRLGQEPGYRLQTDARIFNGNSGGPLLSEDGELVGVNNIMIANTGGSFGLAIPAPMLNKVLKDLERFREVRWCAIGVNLDDDLSVKSVMDGKPANKAGLMVGDRIVALGFGQRAIAAQSTDQVISEISLCDITQPIDIMLVRDGLTRKTRVYPEYNTSDAYKDLPRPGRQEAPKQNSPRQIDPSAVQ